MKNQEEGFDPVTHSAVGVSYLNNLELSSIARYLALELDWHGMYLNLRLIIDYTL